MLTTPNLKALEPYISAEIMELHHTKHHQGYVNGLNAAEESYVKAPSTRERIALQAALKFNGGGNSYLDFRGLTNLT
jgi:superoxide dismutase, Fe-Mn family